MILATFITGFFAFQSFKPGTIVNRQSVKLPKGSFLVPATLESPALVIKGNNLTLDLSKLKLLGSDANAEPDTRAGIGVLITGNNITVKGLTVRGYRHGIIARNCKNLKLIDCNTSYNWKPRLKSGQDKEDVSDWLSFHQNDNNEWARFGEGVYLDSVSGFEVKNLTSVGGINGLMMTRSNGGLIWNSDISYNSGLGIGMYRSSKNRVMHNKLDYNVRGYSHGVYNRGQDSAGILIYEQSNENIFAYNSVTHGGDGFFLWAGQTTMDTGKGGCNDNVVYANDFSHAPTNGIEATFSRNRFLSNYIAECWHGFWTGYSYSSVFDSNVVKNCEEGIAHEHGQDNQIVDNYFIDNKIGLNIWANQKEDPNWGYPKNRDTSSRNLMVTGNTFLQGVAFKLNRTTKALFDSNQFYMSGFSVDPSCKDVSLLKSCLHANEPWKIPANVSEKHTDLMSASEGVDVPNVLEYNEAIEGAIKPLSGGQNAFLKPGERRGRKTIIVDNWGPFDYKSPKVWPIYEKTPGQKRGFDIIGPTGKWRVISSIGYKNLNKRAGTIPDQLSAELDSNALRRELVLEYVGGKTVDVKGNVSAAGVPVRFSHVSAEVILNWSVQFYTWVPNVSDPRKNPNAFLDELKSPITAVSISPLNYAGSGKFEPGVPNNHFKALAESTFEVPTGTYWLDITTDDGIRVYLDDKLVLDSFKYQAPTGYNQKLSLGGKHKLRIHYFQIDGYAVLKADLKPAQ